MTRNYWDYLKHNLEKQLDAQQQLIQLIEQENDLLIANKNVTLPEIISQQDFLTSQITYLQSEKNELISKILLDESQPSLTKLINIAPTYLKQKFIILQKELQKQTAALKKASDLNARLIDTNLKYVTHMMNAITKEVSADRAIYGSTGVIIEKQHQTLLELVG